MNDKELIIAYKKGDNDALAKLMEKYKPLMLYISISILKDRRRAEDCIQDLSQVWISKSVDQRKTMFTNSESARSFIATSIKNKAIEIQRKIKNQEKYILDKIESEGPEPYDFSEEIYGITRDELKEAIAALKIECKEFLELYLVPNMTRKKMMIEMNIDKKKHASLYNKSRNHLKKKLLKIRNSKKI